VEDRRPAVRGAVSGCNLVGFRRGGGIGSKRVR
jgi:hypothetical protein